jgi:hypothetical protein
MVNRCLLELALRGRAISSSDLRSASTPIRSAAWAPGSISAVATTYPPVSAARVPVSINAPNDAGARKPQMPVPTA